MALSTEQLALLDETGQVHIETRADGKATKTIIWVVVDAGKVYVRSVRGESGRWYKRAVANPLLAIEAGDDRMEFRAMQVDDPDEIEAVTRALRNKYPPGGPLDRMTREEVLGTTLRLEPIS